MTAAGPIAIDLGIGQPHGGDLPCVPMAKKAAGGSMPKPPKKAGPSATVVVDDTLLERAETLIRKDRAVKREALPEWKRLAAAGQAELVAGLVARGLEVGDKGVLRVPLREQVAALAQRGTHLKWKQASKSEQKEVEEHIAGASSAERDATLAEAFHEKRLRLVVRTTVDTVVGEREPVLTADEVERLVEAHETLGDVLKLLGSKLASKGPLADVKKTLLRVDAADLVKPFSAFINGAGQHLSEEASWEVALEQMQQMEEPPILLVWVPDLVKRLSARMNTEKAHAALIAAQRRGLLELRPESGIGRLSPMEAALCPRDADGVPLSHARRLTGR